MTFLILTGCGSPLTVETRFNPHTSVHGLFTNFQLLETSASAYFQASPAITINKNGRKLFGLQTRVIRRDGNFPNITSAVSFGASLPYETSDRRAINCHIICAGEEIGIVYLGEAAFRQSAQKGLTFQLIGKRGIYTGTLPAEAFEMLLARLPSSAD